MGRSVIAGAATLALLALPVVILSTREALRAVPGSIREGSYALGATKWETIWHQVPRHATLDFINNSVMGSMFSQYKTPAFVTLDMTPTFTPELLRKDLDLGLKAGEKLGVPLPVTERTRALVDATVKADYKGMDFGVLLLEQAKKSGLELKPENVKVSTGL
jgi:hypothetical protein